MCAAKHGHLEIMNLLIEFRAEINAEDKVPFRYNHGSVKIASCKVIIFSGWENSFVACS